MPKHYVRREILHTAAAIALTVLVAVAADLADIASFRDVSMAGLAVTAVRSLATAIVVLGAPYAVNGTSRRG
jgi:hypothetical protein